MSAAAQSGWDVVSDAPTSAPTKQGAPQQGSGWEVAADTPTLPYKSDAPPVYAPQADPVTRFFKGVWSTTGAPLADVERATADLGGYLMTGGQQELSPHTKQMISNVLNSHADQAKKAKQAWEQGNYSEAFGHGLATILPVIGPAAAQAGETIGAQQEPTFDKYGNVVKSGQSADVAGGVGQGVGLAGPAALGAAVEKIPTAGRAAANLEKVGQAVDQQLTPFHVQDTTFGPHGPFDVDTPGKIALNAQKLPGAGGGVMQDFLQRLTDPNEGPLTFSEMKDYHDAASSMPTKNLSVSQQQQLVNFKNALSKSMADAAKQVGQEKQYAGAVSEAKSAARNKAIAKTVGKGALKLGKYGVAGAAGAGTAYELGKLILPLLGKASGGAVLDRYPSRESVLDSLRKS